MVREFHPDDGWGVIDGDEVPGGCCVSFDVIRMDGYRELTADQPVRFTFEAVAEQDGYGYRATQAWPIGLAAETPEAELGTSPAYGRNLRLYYDSPDSREH